MLNLLLRDLDADGPVQVYEGKGVCHQIIKNESNFAKFTDQCCFKKRTTGEIICTMDIPNIWLSILDAILIIFMVVVLLFGPFICTNIFYAQTLDTYRYIVNLKEPLHKTVCITKGRVDDVQFMYTHMIDMRTTMTYSKGREIAARLPEDKIIPVKINEFNIDVNYARLLPENEVHVGLFACLSKAIFFCKMREVSVIGKCCRSSVFGFCGKNDDKDERSHWITPCYFVGHLLLVLCLPLPYYIRLVFYYTFEVGDIVGNTTGCDPCAQDYLCITYVTNNWLTSWFLQSALCQAFKVNDLPFSCKFASFGIPNILELKMWIIRNILNKSYQRISALYKTPPKATHYFVNVYQCHRVAPHVHQYCIIMIDRWVIYVIY